MEAACYYCRRDIKTEALGGSAGPVQNVIMALPHNKSWSAIREELKHCFSDQISLGHTAAQLENMTQKPNGPLRLYIYRYSKLHKAVTQKDACQDTDPSRWFRFLVGKWMTNLVATTPITANAMQSLLVELNRQKELKRTYRWCYKDLQTATTTTNTTVTSQPLMSTANTKTSTNPSPLKSSLSQGKKIAGKGKLVNQLIRERNMLLFQHQALWLLHQLFLYPILEISFTIKPK